MEWLCKTYKKVRREKRTYDDVSITNTKSGCGVIIRNSYYKKFNNGIDFAIDGNRLYFADSAWGYKLQDTKNTLDIKHVYFKCLDDITQPLLKFEGNYTLQYDVDLNLYYIEKT